MTDDARALKSVKLYFQVERIFNELRARGLDDNSPIRIEDLLPFDQYHYLGTETIDEAIRALGIGAERHVLDIGAGIGGPARYLAARTGCRVTAVEIQPALHKTAVALTKRCGLAKLVRHVNGDVLTVPLPTAGFDAVVSWLLFLHVPERIPLLARVRSAMQPGARIYVEDFFERGPLTESEWNDLRVQIYAQALPRFKEWGQQFCDAGFTDIAIVDMTERWHPFVTERMEAFRNARARNITVHGKAVVDSLDEFYTTMDRLFGTGHLGGVRVIARNPG
jgi:cyclopropane fatty-acyl-phospholipid synthase-like methyltransferase